MCRFCSTPLTDANAYPNPPSLALVNVCTDEYCVAKLRAACQKVLSCHHPCGGICNEAHCLPCLQCTSGLPQDKDDYCNICWTESLGAAPSIQLTCRHVFHFECVKALVASKWGGYRIHFNFMKCPLCKTNMEHPALEAELAPMRALYNVVKVFFLFCHPSARARASSLLALLLLLVSVNLKHGDSLHGIRVTRRRKP